MLTMNADYINFFLIAASRVLKDMVGLTTQVGKPYLKDTVFDKDSLIVMLGVTGEMTGQVILDFNQSCALDLASKMCNMQFDELSELGESAICELCNMILGNTATVFSTKGYEIDITPPVVYRGGMTIKNNSVKNICIPLYYETDKKIEINVAIDTK